MSVNKHSILSLPYPISERLRFNTDPDLHLHEYSTRADVRRVRHLIPTLAHIGKKRLAIIDAWLEEEGP